MWDGGTNISLHPMFKHGDNTNKTKFPSLEKKKNLSNLKIHPFTYFQIFQHAKITIYVKQDLLNLFLFFFNRNQILMSWPISPFNLNIIPHPLGECASKEHMSPILQYIFITQYTIIIICDFPMSLQ
jgi:hypothetical protein